MTQDDRVLILPSEAIWAGAVAQLRGRGPGNKLLHEESSL